MFEELGDGPFQIEPAGFMPLMQQRLLLADALAGVELGAWDERIVTWLAGWETGTVITVWSWLRRVRQAFGVENGMPAHPQSMKLPRKTGSR